MIKLKRLLLYLNDGSMRTLYVSSFAYSRRKNNVLYIRNGIYGQAGNVYCLYVDTL